MPEKKYKAILFLDNCNDYREREHFCAFFITKLYSTDLINGQRHFTFIGVHTNTDFLQKMLNTCKSGRGITALKKRNKNHVKDTLWRELNAWKSIKKKN